MDLIVISEKGNVVFSWGLLIVDDDIEFLFTFFMYPFPFLCCGFSGSTVLPGTLLFVEVVSMMRLLKQVEDCGVV